MKTQSGSTDKIGNMIRQAGPEATPQGMTERIMHRIEATALKKSPYISPVISIRGWILIGGSVFALIILFLLTGSGGEISSNSRFIAKAFLPSFQNLNLPFHFDFRVPKPLLFGVAGLLLLLSLDFLLSTLKWKKDTYREQP